MFEKSLYDLIRGLRNHKGNEREYLANCLKECRAEARSQDMDLKATAVLKLVYLEMMGHDMSWASFHVLEVMSSPKYHQKRIGYLGAVQSFRSDTEVLMLATNLLKKDLTSAQIPTMSLPISTLPHIITPSLALSVLSDLLPRLGHTNAAVRKKTIVSLYRLALVYPETLRVAWPKIKDKLMNKEEDASVTAAIVNVVCELGWRRPHDFLPLAPRLFELLVDGGNNWMAIKLIKLFATLTPLEPRLVRKLLPPLTEIIRTTPAMSLLYECINGIIQGGILGASDDDSGREEIASLCVSKLRGMVSIHGDPNLKYVALLAFNRIVQTHPFLVAQQEDVILECIDSEDISIRIKALDLVQGMVNNTNLVSIVSRLMRQLKAAASSAEKRNGHKSEEVAVEDEEDPESLLRPQAQPDGVTYLPDDYRVDVIGRILTMCSSNNYANLTDFDAFIDILTQLVRNAPVATKSDDADIAPASSSRATDISERIGNELRIVAVKVRAVRPSAVRAAELVISDLNSSSSGSRPLDFRVLKPLSWLVGEYSEELSSPEDMLSLLLQLAARAKDPEVLASCLHAVVKIFSHTAGDQLSGWTSERKSSTALLIARIIHTFEPFVSHPYLEVQERAVEFTELLKLTAEAVSGQLASTGDSHADPPLLLTQAIPSLFQGWELNSVAVGAQQNVPLPTLIDLDQPIHSNLEHLLAQADSLMLPAAAEDDEFEMYYHQRPAPTSIGSEPAISRLAERPEEASPSYQQAPTEDSYLDADILARRKAERQERNKNDPFYIGTSGSDPGRGTSTPIHDILQNQNGPDLDIDAIPIMQLDLEKLSSGLPSNPSQQQLSSSLPSRGIAAGNRNSRPRPTPRQKVLIAADETLGASGTSTPRNASESENNSDFASRAKKLKAKSLLQVDSSHLGSLTLEGEDDESNGVINGNGGTISKAKSNSGIEQQLRDEAEMAKAVKEVERLRLEMQRASERIEVAQGVPVEGNVIARKKKKVVKKAPAPDGEAAAEEGAVKVKKKKKTKLKAATEGEVTESADPAGPTAVKVAKRKKKVARVVELGGDEPTEPVVGQ
jgi:AP-3 complex subunit delta